MNVGKVLASESEKLSNAYYDESTRHTHMDDLIFNNRYRQAFQSLNFSSTIKFQINNSDFISNVFLAMRFPGVASAGGNVMNLVPLAAYAAISEVEITVGGSTQYKQSGINMLHDILGVCDSKSKRDELIRFGGADGTNGFTTDQTYFAYLNVPWASIAAETKKLPFDTNLIKQPIEIQITLNPANSVYYQTGGTGLIIPSSLTEGELILRQGQLKDPSKRLQLGTQIMQDGEIMTMSDKYAYPFMYSQTFITNTFPGSAVGNPPTQVSLSGFRRGHLQAIRFMLYNATTSPISYPASASTNIIKTEDPLNFELLFNGQTIFRSKYDSWKMSDLMQDSSATYVSTTPGGTSYYNVLVNVVDFIEKIAGEAFQDGLDLSSQNLIVSLNTPTTDNYIIHCTYLYHAHLVCDGSNAEYIFE